MLRNKCQYYLNNHPVGNKGCPKHQTKVNACEVPRNHILLSDKISQCSFITNITRIRKLQCKKEKKNEKAITT